jgi:hypothetical protein
MTSMIPFLANRVISAFCWLSVAASIATWRFDRRFAWSARSASATHAVQSDERAKVSLAP